MKTIFRYLCYLVFLVSWAIVNIASDSKFKVDSTGSVDVLPYGSVEFAQSVDVKCVSDQPFYIGGVWSTDNQISWTAQAGGYQILGNRSVKCSFTTLNDGLVAYRVKLPLILIILIYLIPVLAVSYIYYASWDNK
jgi:hypothetical protein